MPEKKIVLEEINMANNMIEYHNIEPVRVIVIIKRYRRTGVYHRLIWIMGILSIAVPCKKNSIVYNCYRILHVEQFYCVVEIHI